MSLPGAVESMRAEVLEGLTRPLRELSPKHLYDERGSKIFEEITRLPEYYLTRVERGLLREWVPAWIRDLRPQALVELGAGSAKKTRVALDAMEDEGSGDLFVPVDVSAVFLQEVADELRADYPDLRIEPVVLDMAHSLEIPEPLPRPALFLLLGSTLGNFYPQDATDLLHRIRDRMADEDHLLLGLDLRPSPRKPVEVLEAAYNDSRGVTARFTSNVLRVLNRELGSDFDLEGYRHRARYNSEEGRMELGLVSLRDQTVRFPGGATLEIREGEEIRTEVSCKYDRTSADALLKPAGLEVRRWVQDGDDRFALVLTGPQRAPHS